MTDKALHCCQEQEPRTLSPLCKYDDPFTATMRLNEFLSPSTHPEAICENSQEWGWVEWDKGEISKSQHYLKGQLGLLDWA